MGITLRQALCLESLRNAEVVSGYNGLDKDIMLVNVMEVPDIYDWICPDELILTTGYPFKDSPEKLAELIIELQKKNVVGIAIKTNRFIKEIPQEIINISNKLDFTIISLPYDAQFDKIILELMTKIINEDYYVIKKTNEIHKTLTNLVHEGSNFEEISQALSNLCFGEITLKDISGRILANSKPKTGLALISDTSSSSGEKYEKQVRLGNQIIGHINLKSWRNSIEHEDFVALDFTATIIAMMLFKIETTKEKERRYRNDFLNNLVLNRIASSEIAVQQGEKYGLDLNAPYVVLNIKIHFKAKKPDKNRNETSDTLEKLINNSFLFTGRKYICWSNCDGIIVFCPIQAKDKSAAKAAVSIAGNIKKTIQDFLQDSTVTIGIGRYYQGILNISKSYADARKSTEIGSLIWGIDGVYHYDDLGIYSLLFEFSSKDEINSFINNLLGDLIEYDKRKGNQFLSTLEQLLTNDNFKNIAQKLYIHPKTLTFRKNRIEEILGFSLDDSEKRLTLSVAIKLYHLNNLDESV